MIDFDSIEFDDLSEYDQAIVARVAIMTESGELSDDKAEEAARREQA